ncbi:MAG TPA: BrnT family toxin [Thermoanaerobaculia bacterium]|nr:BrnT family toxin [Thermoanaerobaculia bacterium]
MRFEWDEAKREANLRKHGIDFIDVESLFEGHTVTIEDERFGYGERRFVTFGLLEGRVVAMVHSETDEVIRIISIRKATRSEESSYFSSIPD